jgi:hypothetical protein
MIGDTAPPDAAASSLSSSGAPELQPQARPDVTRAVARGATRLLRQMGYVALPEMVFANGRRADIVGLSPQGLILVIEVKSGLEDFRVDVKWPDYRAYCDQFAFAVDLDFPAARLPDDVGLIIADAFGGEWMRNGTSHPLSGPRRKALTLHFARLAAARLHALDDGKVAPA